MQTITRCFQAAFALLALSALAVVAAPPRVAVDDLRAGQTGYGLTVFHGTEPDTFGVTILGVRHGARAGGDIIMVELSGHDLERTAVAQGMSGSPVYLDDGRLVGAVAFGWPGALRPIAGLTPAADLDVARDRREVASASAAGASSTPADPAALLGDPAAAGLAASLFPDIETTTAPPAAWPRPGDLARDLLPMTRAMATSQLAPLEMGLFALPAGAAAAGAVSPRLEPGSACAVALVTGDAQLGAIGTVSLVDGDRIVCMAHPFMQLGPVDLPLAAAEIVTMFPSRQISFKMGSAGAVVGRVTHDLRAGLAGDLGRSAPTAPVSVTVNRPDGSRAFGFRVAQQPRLTPQLVFWCLYNAVLAEGDDQSAQLVRYDVELTLAGADGVPREPIRLEGVTGGPGGVAALAADWQAPLQILLENRHERLSLTAVRAELTVERPVRAARIVALHGPARIEPGEVFTVEVVLEPRRGPRRRERFELRAPAGLAPGPLRLGAASAREFFQLDAVRAAGLFEDHTLAATIELLGRPRSLDELTVALISTTPGVTSGGREMAGLPASVRRTLAMGPPGTTRPTTAAYLARSARPVGMILQGNAVLDVEVHAQPAPRPEGDRP